MPTPQPVIVWFRDDLRVSDHPALHAAAKTGSPVICLYVLDDTAGRPSGAAARWWLAQSLRALGAEIAARGGSLVLRKGPAAKVVAELARESGACAVHWNEIAQAPHQAVERQLEAALARLGINSQIFPGDLTVSPRQSVTRKAGPCAYSRRSGGGCCRSAIRQSRCLRRKSCALRRGLRAMRWRAGSSSRPKPDWAGGLRETWSPGETSARARLRDFLKRTARVYVGDRDRPDREGTSSLSPHLRFGEPSPRQSGMRRGSRRRKSRPSGPASRSS